MVRGDRHLKLIQSKSFNLFSRSTWHAQIYAFTSPYILVQDLSILILVTIRMDLWRKMRSSNISKTTLQASIR